MKQSYKQRQQEIKNNNSRGSVNTWKWPIASLLERTATLVTTSLIFYCLVLFSTHSCNRKHHIVTSRTMTNTTCLQTSSLLTLEHKVYINFWKQTCCMLQNEALYSMTHRGSLNVWLLTSTGLLSNQDCFEWQKKLWRSLYLVSTEKSCQSQ